MGWIKDKYIFPIVSFPLPGHTQDKFNLTFQEDLFALVRAHSFVSVQKLYRLILAIDYGLTHIV